MRIRKKPWCAMELAECPFCVKDPCNKRGGWRSEFSDPSKPLHLELGCGKGGFISVTAAQNPEVNFLATDIKNEMLGLAKRKIQQVYDRPIDNVRIFISNIEKISEIFSAYDAVDRIYINFCNPWPRGKHYKKRLTHQRQLTQYSQFMADDGEIWFKTDSDELFRHSQKYFLDSGFELKVVSYDMHTEIDPDISARTEHEEMFSSEGIKIKFLIAKKIMRDCV